MNILFFELFEKVDAAKTKLEKIKLLQQFDSQPLRGLLRINFDPNLKMNLPEGEPPFKKDLDKPIGYDETNLLTEFRRFYIWFDQNLNLSKLKREQLFVDLLEGLNFREAEMLCLVKDKKLTSRFKTLKEDIVREAFPELLPPKESKTTKENV